MKLFGRSGGYYLFWTSAVYFFVGMYCVFVNEFVPVWLAQVLWISVLAFPFTYPPFGRWLNMDINWDRKMFGKDKDSKVIKFPDPVATPKATPPQPEVKKPKEEEPAKIYYRFGLTDNNRVAFSMGYSEITMNKTGCQNLIDQIAFFMNQIEDDYVEEESDSDDSGASKN